MDLNRIREGLRQPGKSQRGLARALGIDDAAVSRLLNNGRQLKASEIQKVEDYLGLDERKGIREALEQGHVVRIGSDTQGRLKVEPQIPMLAGINDRIPVLGMAECGPDGWSLFNGDTVDYVQRPPNLSGAAQAYAVYITGSSMEPRYNQGEIAFIHPAKPITSDCFVLVQIKPPPSDHVPRAMIKRFLKRKGSSVLLHQLNPAKDITLPAADVITMHRVVGSGEA